jgi:hypothetical protein
MRCNAHILSPTRRILEKRGQCMGIYRRSFQIRQREDAKSLSSKDISIGVGERRYKYPWKRAVTELPLLTMKVFLYPLAIFCSISFVYGAVGSLTINSKNYDNPKGCYKNLYAPLNVFNRSNKVAYVFKSSNCTGEFQSVDPGAFFNGESTHSIQIDVQNY